jgi:hypothetical protein
MQVIVIDIGDSVVCDLCSKDFTNRKDCGGFLFLSKGVCPDCAPKFEADGIKYGEQEYIRDRAEPQESFKDFVLRIRG